ncbi:HAD family hydrolase [Verrucomicrobiales bacterium]|nr:HAD family hydrolase [Verrucomicrobiales bacterium]MDB4737311.1 HAD family hydrolase [Verrucomicrobiales bacterium]
MSRFRNIIFDWSGTLVDDLNPVIEATNQVLMHYGKSSLTRKEFCDSFCLPFVDFYKSVLPGVPISELEEMYTLFFDESEESVEILPGAVDLLNFCKESGFGAFLLSSIKNDHYVRQSEYLNLNIYFEKVYTEALDKRIWIRSLIDDCSLNSQETIFVGDMQHDIEAGHSAGVFTVAVLGGYTSEEMLLESAPDLVIDNLYQLSDYLSSK